MDCKAPEGTPFYQLWPNLWTYVPRSSNFARGGQEGSYLTRSRPVLLLTAEFAVVEVHGTEKYRFQVKECPSGNKLSNLSNELIQRVGKSYPQRLMWQQEEIRQSAM